MKSLPSKLSLLGSRNINRPFLGLFLFLTTLVFVSGQTGRREGFNAEIPFGFQIGTKSLSAGTYSFVFDQSSNAVSIIGSRQKEHGRLAVITRLGARAPKESATVIFDKLNEIRTLSEIWIPGVDGLLVHITSKEHSHEVIRVAVEVALR